MNEEINEKTQTLKPFTKLCMTIGQLPSSYVESMSYYEQLIWFTKYLQDQVIPAVNQNAAAVTELQGYYIELQDYVNNYFDNLDVQQEINNKLDKMAEDGSLLDIINQYFADEIQPQINTQNAKIGELETKVNAVTSGSPLVASSTAGMTDTTKVYVNTTDGKWYYYDGDSWEIGGTYQSTGLDTNSVHFNNLDSTLDTMLFRESSDVSQLGTIYYSNTDSSYNMTSFFYLKKGSSISVSDDFLANYKWKLMEVIGLNSYNNLFTFTTDSSKTMSKDALCVFAWQPIDETWSESTYTVDRFHNLDNNDITSITYYYPKFTENFLLEDLDGSFLNSCFVFANQQTLSGTIKMIHTRNTMRLCQCRAIKSKFDIKFSIKTGYKYGIVTYESDGITRKADTGWMTDDYILPANSLFTVVFAKSNDAAFTDLYTMYHDKILTMTSYGDINFIKTTINNLGIANYYYNGEKLDTKNKYGFNISNLYQFDNKMTGGYSQGFAIANNYIAQLYANTGIQLRNFSTNEVVSNINLSTIGHGDTCQFSKTYYNNNDILPLLYVCTDTNPASIVVVRISDTTTAEVVETINLTADYGYYCGECFDTNNNIMYVIGYKNNDYRTNANGNEMIVSKYNLTTNSLIERWNIPFIYCIQGQKFFNGKCILLSSGVYTEQTTKIYVYDPTYKQMTSTFESFNTDILNGEQEDIDFVVNSSNNYDLIIGDRSYYRKISFVS